MPVKIKIQKDYYLTEVTVGLPANVAEVDELLKLTKANGKMVVLYNGGSIQGINVEQKTKLTESKSVEIRDALGIETKELDVQ